jgi:hypothetical protein
MIENPALRGRKSVRSWEPPDCQQRYKWGRNKLTLREDTDTASFLQSSEHCSIRVLLLHMWQDLVLQSRLDFRLRPDLSGRLDVLLSRLGGDDKLPLELELGIRDDLVDRRRSVPGRLWEDELRARLDLRGEFRVEAGDDQRGRVGEDNSACSSLGVVGSSGDGYWAMSASDTEG